MKKPTILLTNDDGVDATGIRAAAEVLNQFGDLYVAAPQGNRSAIGTAITLWEPVPVQEIVFPGAAGAWRIDGTPCDCVKLAMSKLLPHPPTLVLSGINCGENFARNILHSGTAAAAWVASHRRNLASIAVSSCGREDKDILASAHWLAELVEFVFENPPPWGTFLNVNTPPDCARRGIKGIKMTRQGMMMWEEDPFHTSDGHMMVGGKLVEFEEHEESDLVWLERGYATVAPIASLDLTDYGYLKANQHKMAGLGLAKLDP